MKANVTNNYQVTLNKTYTGEYDLDGLEAYITEQELVIENEYDLRDAIDDYLFWGLDLSFQDPTDGDNESDNDDLEINNIEELIHFYYHLIKEIPCCSKAPYGALYCPTCGTRIR